MPKKHIVILGAGVIGLTTATLLQQEKEFEVTVIARHFPGDLSIDYTSPWAGAHWRSYATNDDSRLIEYEKKTFHHFWNLAKASKNNSGIMIVDGFDYWDRLPDDFSEPSPEPDLEEASAIVQRCLSTRPDLLPHDQTNLVIKKNCVGLRPCRKG
ncbi:12348_t:CDS:2, partial [Gigaspora rosea]